MSLPTVLIQRGGQVCTKSPIDQSKKGVMDKFIEQTTFCQFEMQVISKKVKLFIEQNRMQRHLTQKH